MHGAAPGSRIGFVPVLKELKKTEVNAKVVRETPAALLKKAEVLEERAARYLSGKQNVYSFNSTLDSSSKARARKQQAANEREARDLQRSADRLRARAGEGKPAQVQPWVSIGKKDRATFDVVDRRAFQKLRAEQKKAPVLLGSEGENSFFWFRDKVYVTTEDLSTNDVHALVTVDENKKRLQLEKAHALVAMTRQLDERLKRQPISQDLKLLVWQRDAGRCVECGSHEELEYDHVIPLAMGGSNTDRNLQLLCAVCNRRKGASLG